MTVDAPAAAADPLRFVRALAAALASAGVVTLCVRHMLGTTPLVIVPDAGSVVATWLAPIVAVLMVSAACAAVAVRPALGRAGGWPVTAVGIAVSTLVVQTMLGVVRLDAALAWTLVMVSGFGIALAGLLVAAAQAPLAEAVAIAVGVAYGLAAQRINLDLLSFGPIASTLSRMTPYYIVLGLAVAAAALVLTRPTGDAPQRGAGAFGQVLIVGAVAAVVQLGHWVRRLVVEEFRLSPDGLASQRRVDAVAAFVEYSATALAAAAGLILMWLAYRRGKADLARWVVLGFGLGAPAIVLLFGFYYGGSDRLVILVSTALLAAAAGAALSLAADRFFAWDALGVAVAAVGMITSSVSYRIGPGTTDLAYLLISGGVTLALAAGLTRTVRLTKSGPAGHATTGQIALSLSLGLIALIVTADAVIMSAYALANSTGFGGLQLSLPIASLVAAGVIVLLFGFRRTVDRVRREIHEQAAQSPPSQ